jgi:hypothetical protein
MKSPLNGAEFQLNKKSVPITGLKRFERFNFYLGETAWVER